MFDFNLICENIYIKNYRLFFTDGLMGPIPLISSKSKALKVYFKNKFDEALYTPTFSPICISIRKDISIVNEKIIRSFLKDLAATHFDNLCICFSFYDETLSLISSCETAIIPKKQVEKDLYDIFKNSEVLYDYDTIDNYFEAI